MENFKINLETPFFRPKEWEACSLRLPEFRGWGKCFVFVVGKWWDWILAWL